MTKEELEKKLEDLKEQIFMIDMIDHWTNGEGKVWDNLTKQIQEIEHKLELIND